MRVHIAAGVLAASALLFACTDAATIQSEASTCRGAVRAFLDFATQMNEDLDPERDPSPELIHEQTDRAIELRTKAAEACGGEAGFLEELARQRAPQEAP